MFCPLESSLHIVQDKLCMIWLLSPQWACSPGPPLGSRCSGSDWVAPSPLSRPLGPMAELGIRRHRKTLQRCTETQNAAQLCCGLFKKKKLTKKKTNKKTQILDAANTT